MSSVTISSGPRHHIPHLLNLESVEEVFLLNVKFLQHLKKAESRDGAATDSVIYGNEIEAKNVDSVGLGNHPQSSLIVVEKPIYID